MKYYASPRWSNELLDCSMPMSFDTYNKCSYNCLYCFSFYQKSHESSPSKLSTKHKGFKDYQKGALEWVNLKKVERLFKGELPKSQFHDFAKKKIVMQWGGLADQFDNYERRTGMSLQLMKLFDEVDYPLSFSTKSCWFTKDDRYMDLIKKHPHNWHFKFSIINLDKERARKMEKGVESPEERIKAMKRIVDLGCHVTLRLRPFIIGYTNRGNEHLELIKLSREAGADSISTEFFCLEQRANKQLLDRYKQMSEIIGFDIMKFYKANSDPRGYLRLNYNIKTRYINEMKDLCDKIGMRFFVSDAHHKEKCFNGSCCGLPTDWNYSRGQFTEAIVIAKNKGKVYFKDIKPPECWKEIRWGRAEGLNTKSQEHRLKADKLTLYEYFRNHWNNPNRANSPYKYFGGILYPIGLDENKDVIYEYRPKDDCKECVISKSCNDEPKK